MSSNAEVVKLFEKAGNFDPGVKWEDLFESNAKLLLEELGNMLEIKGNTMFGASIQQDLKQEEEIDKLVEELE